MLKNIDPLLTPDTLYVLSCMGQGDEVVVCDAHVPAGFVARTTTYRCVIRADRADTREEPICAQTEFAVIQTGETLPYGCLVLRKGLTATADAPARAGRSHLNQYAVY
jgi:L-fucose mutarotase/ribose pyranase (RbsD/FucU family)